MPGRQTDLTPDAAARSPPDRRRSAHVRPRRRRVPGAISTAPPATSSRTSATASGATCPRSLAHGSRAVRVSPMAGSPGSAGTSTVTNTVSSWTINAAPLGQTRRQRAALRGQHRRLVGDPPGLLRRREDEHAARPPARTAPAASALRRSPRSPARADSPVHHRRARRDGRREAGHDRRHRTRTDTSPSACRSNPSRMEAGSAERAASRTGSSASAARAAWRAACWASTAVQPISTPCHAATASTTHHRQQDHRLHARLSSWSVHGAHARSGARHGTRPHVVPRSVHEVRCYDRTMSESDNGAAPNNTSGEDRQFVHFTFYKLDRGFRRTAGRRARGGAGRVRGGGRAVRRAVRDPRLLDVRPARPTPT